PMKKHLVVLTGAGMSAESGIETFRDADGLWEGHDVMEVATPEGFARNPELVLDFYNQRRRQLFEVEPNAAHKALAALEDHFDVSIITQNVDDLHERAGSSNIIHLHGELLKARSSYNDTDIFDWKNDITLKDRCKKGHQIRPHLVRFGVAMPRIASGSLLCEKAYMLMIISAPMQFYPASALMHFATPATSISSLDPTPAITHSKHATVIAQNPTPGLPKALEL